MQWIRNGKKYDTETAELIWQDYKFVRVPLNEASKFAEENLPVEGYERAFGKVEE